MGSARGSPRCPRCNVRWVSEADTARGTREVGRHRAAHSAARKTVAIENKSTTRTQPPANQRHSVTTRGAWQRVMRRQGPRAGHVVYGAVRSASTNEGHLGCPPQEACAPNNRPQNQAFHPSPDPRTPAPSLGTDHGALLFASRDLNGRIHQAPQPVASSCNLLADLVRGQ